MVPIGVEKASTLIGHGACLIVAEGGKGGNNGGAVSVDRRPKSRRNFIVLFLRDFGRKIATAHVDHRGQPVGALDGFERESGSPTLSGVP